MSERPHYTVVCALIERGGRVLVAQRSTTQAQAGKWEFPGGKIEPGESPAAALVREIREELHLDVTVGARLPDAFHDYGAFVITLVPFLAAGDTGAEPHPVEHAAVRWCTPAELRTLDWAPADVPVVEHYLVARGDGKKPPIRDNAVGTTD
jgi:8-oxo-dGTP diphosphatase